MGVLPQIISVTSIETDSKCNSIDSQQLSSDMIHRNSLPDIQEVGLGACCHFTCHVGMVTVVMVTVVMVTCHGSFVMVAVVMVTVVMVAVVMVAVVMVTVVMVAVVMVVVVMGYIH